MVLTLAAFSFISVQRLILRHGFQIHFWITVQNQIRIGQRVVVNKVIKFRPLAYAELILNGDPEVYLKTVTEYKPLD